MVDINYDKVGLGKPSKYYKYIDTAWIQKQISKAYGECDMERELIINISLSNYGALGYVMFALNGSPPKGCAIYQPDHKLIIFIDAWGKIKKYENTIINQKTMDEIKKNIKK